MKRKYLIEERDLNEERAEFSETDDVSPKSELKKSKIKKVNTNDFVYQNIASKPLIITPNVASMVYKDKFIRFFASPKITSGNTTSLKETGWKIHCAIDDTQQENLAKAWDIIKDILIEEEISLSKVVKPNVKLANHPLQSGKQITIYAHYDLEKNWPSILAKIDQALADAKITKAETSPNDKPIKGSIYLSYRNDSNKEGAYVPAEDAETFNESSEQDPFADIELVTKLSDDQEKNATYCQIM